MVATIYRQATELPPPQSQDKRDRREPGYNEITPCRR
jgi:hypothetical protein